MKIKRDWMGDPEDDFGYKQLPYEPDAPDDYEYVVTGREADFIYDPIKDRKGWE